MRSEVVEHGSQVIKVLFRDGIDNEYVVDVGVCRQGVAKNLVHEPLKV